MPTEAKREFDKKELDILDELRFVLETQADAVNPAGDLVIRSAANYSTAKEDILDRIRRATDRIYKHTPAGASRTSNDTTVTGTPAALLATVMGQVDVFVPQLSGLSLISTTDGSPGTIVFSLGLGQQQGLANETIVLSGCSNSFDDGTYRVIGFTYDSLNAEMTYEIESFPLGFGGSTSGTVSTGYTTYLISVNAATGLNPGDNLEIIGSDNFDGIYAFVGEAPNSLNPGWYDIEVEELVNVSAGTYGEAWSIEVIADLVIPHSYNTLFVSVNMWKQDGTDIWATIASYCTRTTAEITVPSNIVDGIGLAIGDIVHYSIDDHS